ncbi:hypothetical protein [uncultured Neptuniibacter sp.]|uniref:hypothetical protein n=1 Tax=uncultured Neptuniibacter sp. TaxID=502143 RepID=UPI00261B96ED|nr:hypothetical protein [uncultured Neptuniibacter sp.]
MKAQSVISQNVISAWFSSKKTKRFYSLIKPDLRPGTTVITDSRMRREMASKMPVFISSFKTIGYEFIGFAFEDIVIK